MNSKRVLLQPAFVLHRRAYRETSFLVELFTQEFGRLTLIARGVRKMHSATFGLIQPFSPLLVSWSGKGELMTLSYIETKSVVRRLNKESLFAGLYLNELLMCLLQKWDVHTELFINYEKTITMLQQGLEEKILRMFEKSLFEELGYGVLPKSDISLQKAFLPEKYYRFIFEQGFVLGNTMDVSGAEVPVERPSNHQSNLFSGKNLLAIANNHWQDEAVLRDAKRLTRLMLASLLGARQIYSRQLLS
ncbi:MAG: DNA repair protein RecO [Gammaproteobacteria bacterium RIFCSPHIGHO2_12_FULL_37_14]|nr:MAG: DNA repair protein RecO [Gammaproteobacteria bacterium RIFCSPHIGHO2_12_FULL_37_14]